jgi:protein TonB
MALANYKQLALSWQPSQKEDRLFAIFAAVAVVTSMLIGGVISSIPVPEKTRNERAAVPERVAKFIDLKEAKPKPPPPPPAVKPPEPPKPAEVKAEPKPEPAQPRIERERPKPREPLTTEQQKAREKASQSGLLAHMNELNDLMDTPEVAAQVKTDIRQQAGSGDQPVAPDTSVLTANASRGSGGVEASRYAARAGDSQLGAAEVAAAREALAASETAFAKEETAATRSGGARTRSEEEVTLVFDRHKSQLQSLYNRARRNNPALKGKLVLAVTIRPDGTVSAVKAVSSELQDQALLDSLMARIRNFQFGARDVETVTVNYPIEFLPY